MLDQSIIPAIKSPEHLSAFLASPLKLGILMNFDLIDVEAIIKTLHQNHKKVILHLELTRGIANDEFGAIFAIQELKVDGLISSKQKVIELAKKRNVLGIYRLFLKDTLAFAANVRQLKHIQPDIVEILPSIPKLIYAINQGCQATIISGGLLLDAIDIKKALDAGATAVTVSKIELWSYEKGTSHV